MKWSPTPEIVRQSNIYRVMRELGFEQYADFYRWSIAEREKFWETTTKALGIVFRRPYERVLDLTEGVERPRWYAGARMNIADSLFGAPAGQAAIRYAGERDGVLREMSYAGLEALTGDILYSLRKAGLKPGDYVGIDMPMTPMAVAVYIAALRGGFPVVTVADSFSAGEIRKRFAIAPPRLVFTRDYLYRGGKQIPLYEKLIQARAPRCVVVRTGEVDLREGDMFWDDFLEAAGGPQENHEADPMDRITVLFSSGTTSAPKAIPWNHTTAVKSAADGFFHHDIHPGDTVAWPTNLGWMMGPWLIFATLINKGTMALYDGIPTGEGFAGFVQDAGVNMLGVVPALVRAWKNLPAWKWDWSAVKVFSSTGETSHPRDMAWLMQAAGGRPVIEYCGGTEIGGGYVTSTVVQDNYPSTFSTPALGSEFVILDEHFRPADAGEVFLIPPAMGLSVELLNKDHHQTYYAGLPEWEGKTLRRHGDYLVRMENGYFRVMGRTDDSMNLGGIKVGAGQLEEVINRHPNVKESAAVAVAPPEGGPARLVVFAVVYRPQEAEDLQRELQRQIREKLNPLFKIHRLVLRDSLPRTASGKIMRRVLRKEYGEQVQGMNGE